MANLFRILQRHYPQFLEVMRFQLTTRAEFEQLASQLSGIAGRFTLSINDRPEVRKIFAAFDLEAVKTTYSIARKRTKARAAGELIVMPKGDRNSERN